VWYGFFPIAGALYSRYKWKKFRRRFDELRLKPLLDYRQYRQIGSEGGVFRFTGGFESITDGQTLWVKGGDLTIPVSLANTQSWLLPMQEGERIQEAPERIQWNHISTLTEGAKVFVGGMIKIKDNRLSFVSTKETPLMVIFYDYPDTSLAGGTIRAGRTRNEYWNNITPVSVIIGALSLIYIAASFLDRPAFRLTVITALVAVFIPALPWFPPGLLFTVLYRRMAWYARNLRAYRDLARLPLRYLSPGEAGPDGPGSVLSTGEKYGCKKFDSLPAAVQGGRPGAIPFLLPEHSKKRKNSPWYIYGVLDDNSELPQKSKDPFVSFGVLPGDPRVLARRYSIKAYTMEALAWLVLVSGVALNVVFIFRILFLF
jgi:hypothetical protein